MLSASRFLWGNPGCCGSRLWLRNDRHMAAQPQRLGACHWHSPAPWGKRAIYPTVIPGLRGVVRLAWNSGEAYSYRLALPWSLDSMIWRDKWQVKHVGAGGCWCGAGPVGAKPLAQQNAAKKKKEEEWLPWQTGCTGGCFCNTEKNEKEDLLVRLFVPSKENFIKYSMSIYVTGLKITTWKS